MVLLELQLVAGVAGVLGLTVMQDRHVLVDLRRLHPEIDAEGLRPLVVADALAEDGDLLVGKVERLAPRAFPQVGLREDGGRRIAASAWRDDEILADEPAGQRA